MIKKILKIIVAVVAACVCLFAAWLLVLTVTEYKPDDVETLNISGNGEGTVSRGESVTLMSWNTGYGALGEDADFFMAGGKSVKSADEAQIRENIDGIIARIDAVDPDVIFLQETDSNSTRTDHIDEPALYQSHFSDYDSTYALNYKSLFVPYPIPPIGQVESGVLTLSSFAVESAERVQLPCPFSWPVRTANLKRCLNVCRVPVEGSDKELVLINLHLEAFDDGAGKEAQTAALKQFLENEADKGNYVVAGGDFNQIFSGADDGRYPQLEGTWVPGKIDESEFSDVFTFLMDATYPTCRSTDRPLASAESLAPEDFQYYLIDGFVVSDNVSVETMETLDEGFQYTDHNPVLLTFSLT